MFSSLRLAFLPLPPSLLAFKFLEGGNDVIRLAAMFNGELHFAMLGILV